MINLQIRPQRLQRCRMIELGQFEIRYMRLLVINGLSIDGKLKKVMDLYKEIEHGVDM